MSDADKQWGYLGVHQHQVFCRIGIYPEERQQMQALLFNIKVEADLTVCIQSDEMSQTLDYTLLAHTCTRLAQEQDYFLLETLAGTILDHLLQYPLVRWAWIQIQKPSALETAKYVYVELEKSKKE